MQLSKHLSLKEFTHSNTAVTKGIVNTIPEELFNNAKRTATLFEIVREVLDRPCSINSGYRNRILNSTVGGSANSSHMYGCACDVRTNENLSKSKIEQEFVKNHFIANRDKIEFDQLILYWKYGQRFLHIGVSQDTKGRKMIGYRDTNADGGYDWI